MRRKYRQYALCVQAEEDEDLQVRKLYEVLPDELAAQRGHLRVVDDSGEDYLYPAGSFVLLDLPEEAERALHRVSKARGPTPANQAPERVLPAAERRR